MDVMLNEYQFSKGDKVTEIISEDSVKVLRKDFENNCVGCAEDIFTALQRNGTIAATITLKNGKSFTDKPLRVYSELADEYKEYTHHCIVMLGECVIDLLNSDYLQPTKEYIERLQKDNPKLRIDYTLCKALFPNAYGYLQRVTLDFMKNYKAV